MSIWRKLNTLFRASAHEPVAKLVEANDLRIFEQELRDAEQAIARSKRELAYLMAEKTRLERDNDGLQAAIAKREQQASQALEQSDEALALELANLIAEDETVLQRQQQQHAKLQQQENQLRRQLRDSGRALKHFHSEMRLAKANRHAEQVTRQLRGHASGLHSHMEELNVSASRIRARQTEAEDVEAALTELDAEQNNGDLDARLKAAGIDNGDSNGEKVLARLKARQCHDV
ncbi:PspA/IM30 family protein [Marinobacter litoralis]|uniref:PspA/IM30 family protein n=1 Tax=Marinobacter litoralis TaxID=187981 RepID=UPI0018EA4189|nr:PspA/IM30 family protein [Marinobacter litoralis]MBJ6137093.1 PspA/IM30 family protein [Marinobacter litoralis]